MDPGGGPAQRAAARLRARLPFRLHVPALALALLAGAGGAAREVVAQELPPGVELGMNAAALREAVPDATRVHRPARLAGGVAGLWHGAPVHFASLDFEPVFFFGGGRLVRVEYVAADIDAADRGEAAFMALRDWGRARFGAELVTRDPGSDIASWVDGDTDIYAQRSIDARGATVRLVHKARVVKDARTL
jgi:hypothetical protein